MSVLGGIIGVGLIITGCSNPENTSEKPKKIDKGYKVEHVHGISITENDSIYMASHEGLIKTKNYGEKWSFAGKDDFDFMGFHMLSDGTMLTSGHPGPNSDLPNPLGLMESKDNGENWEPKSLHGEVDFHILTSNEANPKFLYGVLQMDSDKYKAGIYKSTNKGDKWKRLKATGLPENLQDIYTLLSMPNDENILLAGTKMGVLRSVDGGETWEMHDSNRLITALSAIPGSTEIISYSITEEDAAMMLSQDNGATWKKVGLELNKDAVAYYAVNPKQKEIIAALTFENNLLLSKDGGQNWETLMEAGKLEKNEKS